MFAVFGIPQVSLPSHPYRIQNRVLCAIIFNSGITTARQAQAPVIVPFAQQVPGGPPVGATTPSLPQVGEPTKP
jgi:hypothetical protein